MGKGVGLFEGLDGVRGSGGWDIRGSVFGFRELGCFGVRRRGVGVFESLGFWDVRGGRGFGGLGVQVVGVTGIGWFRGDWGFGRMSGVGSNVPCSSFRCFQLSCSWFKSTL